MNPVPQSLERRVLCEPRYRPASLVKLGNPFPDTARTTNGGGANDRFSPYHSELPDRL
jgi:hypothetical protein